MANERASVAMPRPLRAGVGVRWRGLVTAAAVMAGAASWHPLAAQVRALAVHRARPATATPVASDAATGNVTCLACHGMANLGYREPTGGGRRFAVDGNAFARSAHAGVGCLQCHGGVAAYPHDSSAAAGRVTCDGDCHATDRAGRPYTHSRQSGELAQSAHGRGLERDNPTCLTCHGGDPHAVQRIATAPPAVRMASCVGCHADSGVAARHGLAADVVTSYERSFHSKAIRFGETTTAGCPDCHTAHHVLGGNDARSTIAPGNLSRTCGRAKCHEGARLNFATSGASHLDLRVARVPLLWLEQRFFELLTAGTMVMLLVGIVLDIQKKFGWARLARRGRAAAGRRVRLARHTLTVHFGRLHVALATSRRVALRAARLLLYD